MLIKHFINQKKMEEIKLVIKCNKVKKQYDDKVKECNSIAMGSDDWFNKNSQCKAEESELRNKVFKLESEATIIKNKNYNGYYSKVEPMSYQIYYIIGASIFGLAILGAFIIYLVKGKKSY